HEGDYSRAAEAMGVTRANLSAHLGTARIRILKLWHQGEVPSRPWFEARPGAGNTAVQAIRARQTNGSPQRLPVHGRERYYKHRCRCQTCRAAARADTVQANDRRRERLGRKARNRLTVSQLAQVREQIASGASQSQLARQYGVHQTYISNLLRGKSRPAPDLTPLRRTDVQLPTLEEMRRNAYRLLGDAQQELASDWSGSGPTDEQADALGEALRAIAKAKVALDKVARAAR
ncbi:helix-turn-helix domain-containing protein, partial [Nonomuraea sp. NPDC059023]|uniref:helix-turn-helix domain-containing protein n=1 Tax=unclassified Nonomuraea TaxID=2593643 RepID=UPI003696D878